MISVKRKANQIKPIYIRFPKRSSFAIDNGVREGYAGLIFLNPTELRLIPKNRDSSPAQVGVMFLHNRLNTDSKHGALKIGLLSSDLFTIRIHCPHIISNIVFRHFRAIGLEFVHRW